MDARQLESIQLRLGLARDKLILARKLTVDGYYNDAVSKAYYAMFYASRALLLAVGEDPHKHTGVVSLFGAHFVKTGKTDGKFGRTLAVAKRLREESDYDERKHATKEEAEQAIADADEFIREVQRLLEEALA
jgi:uncharacterized protein (UPF0332 family)